MAGGDLIDRCPVEPLVDHPSVSVGVSACEVDGRSSERRGERPLEASSGEVTRHRLNRQGDRTLNQAMHTIVVTRMAHHPETRAYVARRMAEDKSRGEIRRCLKRFVARRVYRLLEAGPEGLTNTPSPPLEAVGSLRPIGQIIADRWGAETRT